MKKEHGYTACCIDPLCICIFPRTVQHSKEQLTQHKIPRTIVDSSHSVCTSSASEYAVDLISHIHPEFLTSLRLCDLFDHHSSPCHHHHCPANLFSLLPPPPIHFLHSNQGLFKVSHVYDC